MESIPSGSIPDTDVCTEVGWLGDFELNLAWISGGGGGVGGGGTEAREQCFIVLCRSSCKGSLDSVDSKR